VIEPRSRRVGRVDGEELDDGEVITCPTRPAREAVVHQLDARVGLAIIFHDVVGHAETPREARIMYVAPERFRSWPLRAKAVPFLIIVSIVMQIACVVLSGGQSIQERYGRTHVLTGPGKSPTWCTLMVDGGDTDSSLSLGFGEFDGGGLLCLQCSLGLV
jgi:hypothetical protein